MTDDARRNDASDSVTGVRRASASSPAKRRRSAGLRPPRAVTSGRPTRSPRRLSSTSERETHGRTRAPPRSAVARVPRVAHRADAVHSVRCSGRTSPPDLPVVGTPSSGEDGLKFQPNDVSNGAERCASAARAPRDTSTQTYPCRVVLGSTASRDGHEAHRARARAAAELVHAKPGAGGARRAPSARKGGRCGRVEREAFPREPRVARGPWCRERAGVVRLEARVSARAGRTAPRARAGSRPRRGGGERDRERISPTGHGSSRSIAGGAVHSVQERAQERRVRGGGRGRRGRGRGGRWRTREGRA